MIKNVDLSLYLLAMIISKLKHLDIKISGALLEWNHGNYIHESFNVSVDMICSPAGRHRGMDHDINRHEWVWLEAWCCLNNHTITSTVHCIIAVNDIQHDTDVLCFRFCHVMVKSMSCHGKVIIVKQLHHDILISCYDTVRKCIMIQFYNVSW